MRYSQEDSVAYSSNDYTMSLALPLRDNVKVLPCVKSNILAFIHPHLFVIRDVVCCTAYESILDSLKSVNGSSVSLPAASESRG